MTVSESEYICIVDRAAELGCHMPTGLAIMPENFDTAATRRELVVRGEGSTIRTLFRNNQLPLGEFLPSGEKPGFVHNKSHDWAAFIFISGALLSSDPSAVSVALGIISNDLTDVFRGTPDNKIRLDIAVERRGDHVCKKLTYEGDWQVWPKSPMRLGELGVSDYSKEIELFNISVEGKANLSYIVRDSDSQHDALAELSALAVTVEGRKASYFRAR